MSFDIANVIQIDEELRPFCCKGRCIADEKRWAPATVGKLCSRPCAKGEQR